MRERCAEHGLAVGPDGHCVLCRSRAPKRRNPQTAFMHIAIVMIVSGAVIWTLSYTLMRREPALVRSAEGAPEGSSSAVTPTALGSTGNARTTVAADQDEQHLFTERDPRGLPSELRARGETDVGGEYFAGKESYALFLPAASQTQVPHGVLVWISADASGSLPRPEWRQVLAAHRLVWVGPNRVGNEREIALRIGLGLDAVGAAKRRFVLDEARVFVGGFSGGAKTAFRAQLLFPDVFRGALLAGGVEYYREVAANSRSKGSQWPARFGLPANLSMAKTRPVALTTGPNDFNYGQIMDVTAAMRQDTFARVQIFSWQDIGHAPPPADAFDRALTWLEGGS